MVLARAIHRAELHAKVPPAVQERRAQREIELRLENIARLLCMPEVGRDHRAQREPQVEPAVVLPLAHQAEAQERAELEGRMEVRHAPARGVVRAVHRRRAVDAEVELDALGAEEYAA